MGRRGCPGRRQPPGRRLLLHAQRLWTDVNVSAMFNRLQATRWGQHISVVREADVEQFHIHDPPSRGVGSRRHHEHRIAEDICSGAEGKLFLIAVVRGISLFRGCSNADGYIVPR
jgi:hypothetical protein